MHSKPQKEHQWLEKLLGSWTFEGEGMGEPGKPPSKFVGRETVRSLGGLWTVGEWTMDAQGDHPAATSLITLGFDPAQNRYVGTFVSSMMTRLWIYDGSLNAEETKLSLDAEGPSFSGDGTMAKYQDVFEFVNDDHRTLTSFVHMNGAWVQFMQMQSRRVK